MLLISQCYKFIPPFNFQLLSIALKVQSKKLEAKQSLSFLLSPSSIFLLRYFWISFTYNHCIMETANKTGIQSSATDEEIIQHLDRVIQESREKPGALIPLLQLTQKMYGYLPEAAIKKISRELKIPFSEVAGIVGFYSFFSTVPKGRNVVRVCQGTACYVRGGNEVLSAMKNELKIGVGETTKDREFSLEVGRCFGACGLAPVVMINNDVIQRVKPSKIAESLKVYRVKP